MNSRETYDLQRKMYFQTRFDYDLNDKMFMKNYRLVFIIVSFIEFRVFNFEISNKTVDKIKLV